MSLVKRNFISQLNSNHTVIYLITAGFYSILGQVILLRELNVAFYGIELIYILSFGFWLIGTAAGLFFGRISIVPKEKSIASLLVISAFILLIDIAFIRGIRKIFGGVEGGFLPFPIQITGLVIALFPASFCAGTLFQWITKKYISENETLAKAYSIESIGGVIGGLSSTLFLNFEVSNFSAALICSAVTIFAAVYFSFKKGKGLQYLISFALMVFILLLFGFSNKIDLWMTSWNHPFLIETIDTPYNRVTITKPGNQICVFEDDALTYETQGVSAEEFVQLSTLQTGKLSNVLILGGGFEGIAAELLKLPVSKITYVEINKRIIEALKKNLPDYLANSLKDKRVKIIYNDPRKYLQSKNFYDVILVGMPEPMSAQNNRFYTEEFFSQCAEALNNEGMLAFKIISSENIWTSQLTERNKSIYAALKSSFSDVLVLPGAANIYIASKSKLTKDTKFLINRFNERRLKTALVSPQYINYIFTNDRFWEIQRLLAGKTENINSDLKPVCFGFTMNIWLSKFIPELKDLDISLYRIFFLNKSLIIISSVIIFALLFLACKKYYQLRRMVLVFGAGFIGMVLETVSIILYQTKNGILYRDIGFLLMMFMCGLSLGAIIIHRFFKSNKITNYRLAGIFLIITFTFVNFIFYYLTRTGMLYGLLTISIFLLFDGFFVSGIFAFASLYKVSDQIKQLKPLYSFDLIGGSIGSIAASFIFIPVFGILPTVFIITMMIFLLIFIII